MNKTTAILLGFGFIGVPAAASATPPLRIPWPCGVEYPVTQGHNTGSHVGTYNAWAWDFGIPVGGAVAAPADGVVRSVRKNSTTGGCSSAYVNDANYITINHGDGTEAVFTHLLANTIPFNVGDTVKAGDVVGEVGLSGWVCGAHLHFNIQKACTGSGVCETIPAQFISAGDPPNGTRLISDNCGPCGAVLDGTTTIVDELTGCFERKTTYWWKVAEGYADSHFYTIAADAAAADTTGTWLFEVAVAGAYALEVFIPTTDATSTSASYIVSSADGQTTAGPVDQAAQKGWIPLGEYRFEAGQQGSVLLGDNTGEPISQEKHLAYDAIRLTYVPPPPEPEPMPVSDMGSGGPDGGAITGTPPGSDAAISSSDGGHNLPGADAGADATGGPGLVAGEGACGCGTSRSSDATGWGIALAFLFTMSRRRRRRE